MGVTKALAEARQRVILGIEKSTERLGQRREARQGRVHHDTDTALENEFYLQNVTMGISNVVL